jgi:arylsulfatase A
MKYYYLLVLMAASSLLPGCTPNTNKEQIPNVILIMADDMGYECLGSYGSTSYLTPHLDHLATNGIRVSHCISQPLCTPSRVKIMTGLRNDKNYRSFGHLDNDQHTFGNLMQEAGYSTCIAGKWQLNGLAHKDEILDWNDNSRPHKFGFDEYCLWQLTKTKADGERYSNPTIEQNGSVLEVHQNSYGPDIFCNYVLDFIERKKNQPFFVYFPMVLVHDPFVPTPRSTKWDSLDIRYKNNTDYFKDMVAYTDHMVEKISNKLEALQLTENTILIFTGDNGTHYTIHSETISGTITGGKGNTTDAGTRVPLILSWPAKIKKGAVYKGLIDFSDFYPTFADLIGQEVQSDGLSFLPLLKGEIFSGKETCLVHYDPKWGKRVNQYRNQFARTLDYKLYQDGRFFNLNKDALEATPITDKLLTKEEQKIKAQLQNELNHLSKWE